MKKMQRLSLSTVSIKDRGDDVQAVLCLPKAKMDGMTRAEFYHALSERLDDIHAKLMAMWDQRHPEHAAEFAEAVASFEEWRPKP